MQNKHKKLKDIFRSFSFMSIFLAVILFMSWQEAESSAGKDIPGETTTELIVNQLYEDRLNFLFNNYFDPATYLISVKSMVSIPVVEQKPEEVTPAPQRVRLPGLPVTLQDGFGERSMYQALDVFFIGAARGQHMIRSNKITIWVDKNYDDASLAFMRKLANTALLVQPERGDRISIIRHEFPLREKEKDVVYVYLPDDVTARIKQDHMFDVYVQKPSFLATIPVHTQIAIILIILLLILLGVLFYHYRKKQPEEPEPLQADDETIEDLG